MKNMTALILTVLMMTSYLAVVDFTELEEPVAPTHETSARTGADPSVVAITSPKETVCDINGCRNTLEVGEPTTFSAYIQNAGDAAADDLTYSVTVHLTDDQGNVGMIATDAGGNNLVWENLDAMCDDGSVCDFDSTATPHPFAAGAYLGGGKLTLSQNGAPIEWTPTQGQYIIMIEVDSSSDADIANNVEQVYVEVNDWYDIEVDLSWDNYEGGDAKTVTGTDFFTLSVTATGSDTFDPRNVAIRVAVSGDVDAAQFTIDGNNYDLLASQSGISVIEAGVPQLVRTFENETNSLDMTNDTRNVLEFENTWSVSGSVTPSSSNDEARFTIEAELMNYTAFGQYDACVEVFDNTQEEGEENITTYRHFCEVVITNDDRPATDEDAISGSKLTFHDIAISRMGVYQGYNADGTGLPSAFVESGIGGDLNVGASRLYAEVTHRGSDASITYGWDMTYTVTKDGAVVDSGTVDDCTEGLEVSYMHAPLGAGVGASLTGFVCVEVQLSPGEYQFDFDLVMDNESSRQGEPVEWTGATDSRTSNNDARMVADVINNLPIITSFELVTEGDLVVGMGGLLEFSVNAFDVDDPSGTGLNFTYSSQHGDFVGCGGPATAGGTLCSTPLTSQFVGDLSATVVVTDEHGGVVSEFMIVEVWNAAVATATTDAGIEISYPLQYRGIDQFTITTFADMDITDEYTGVVLENFAGSYDAVAVLDYAPSTTRSAADVLTQSLTVTVPNSLGATSMWYIGGNNLWTPMDDTADEAGPTASEFTFTFPANSGMLPAGTIVLMGGELAQAAIPDAAVSGFAATALKSGAIGVTWDITGTLLSSDSIVVGICEGAADCAEPFETTVADEDRAYTYGGSSTTHGTTYYVAVAVCNEEGCSAEGTGTVVADKAVDGDVMATNLNIVQDGDNWVVTWDIDGSTADVAMWHVCYQREDSFTAAEMPTECPDSVMGADATTLTIAMPTSAGSFTYYFTAVPMDALGNMDAQGQMNSIDYFRDADNGNVDDNNGTIGETGDEASSSVPTWAWGAIGGVVVVAFVVGAFILSRGDGEGGDDKDWDY